MATTKDGKVDPWKYAIGDAYSKQDVNCLYKIGRKKVAPARPYSVPELIIGFLK